MQKQAARSKSQWYLQVPFLIIIIPVNPVVNPSDAYKYLFLFRITACLHPPLKID